MDSCQAKEELARLCAFPYEAEHNRNYEEACKLHDLAISKLSMSMNYGNYISLCKAINFHQQRLEALRPVLNGTGAAPPELPTSLSAAEELKSGGRCTISNDMETLHLWKIDPKKKAHPEEKHKHLLQMPVPFYVPTLDLELPDTTYHIRKDRKGGLSAQPHLPRYNIRDASDKQTLYILQAHQYSRLQLPSTSLHRVAAFADPCIIVQVAPTKAGASEMDWVATGRSMKFISSIWGSVDESPDRLGRIGWTPRRFSYGGRNFVWKQEDKDDWNIDTLYEVEKVWPKPGSRTGKREDKTFARKLVWGSYRNCRREVGTIHFAGGIDQVFREYLLASQLTKFAILKERIFL